MIHLETKGPCNSIAYHLKLYTVDQSRHNHITVPNLCAGWLNPPPEKSPSSVFWYFMSSWLLEVTGQYVICEQPSKRRDSFSDCAEGATWQRSCLWAVNVQFRVQLRTSAWVTAITNADLVRTAVVAMVIEWCSFQIPVEDSQRLFDEGTRALLTPGLVYKCTSSLHYTTNTYDYLPILILCLRENDDCLQEEKVNWSFTCSELSFDVDSSVAENYLSRNRKLLELLCWGRLHIGLFSERKMLAVH